METNKTLEKNETFRETKVPEVQDYEVGHEERNTTLVPKPVKILSIREEEVGMSKNHKFIFACKHPDREETIDFSKGKHLVGQTLKTVGTWVSLDKNGQLYKNSLVSKMIVSNNCTKLKQLVGKELPTVQDEDGYLCFKVY